MKYVISGLFNAFPVHFKELNIDIYEIFTKFGANPDVLKKPIGKVDACVFTAYLEEVVRRTKNHRIGIESGFLIPFMLTGTFYNLYQGCKTVKELFENLEFLDSTANNLTNYHMRIEGNFLHYEISIDADYTRKHPLATRVWSEMQYGIGLQYAYSFTGRFLHPVAAFSPYPKEGTSDLLEEYLDCPVLYNEGKMGMKFKKSVLDLPVITTKKELFPVFENVMGEIEYTQNRDNLSSAVRRYLTHSLSSVNSDLKSVAERFNMSERNIQRKLKAESTSYQIILDDLRKELSQKYLHENIPLSEISFLLGFETQSAFNKFFQKHFKMTPGQFR